MLLGIAALEFVVLEVVSTGFVLFVAEVLGFVVLEVDSLLDEALELD